MNLKDIQRMDDLSPHMLSIISWIQQDNSTKTIQILSKWSLWYFLQEIANSYSKWENGISEYSDDLASLDFQLLGIEEQIKNISNLPTEIETEIIYLRWLLKYISVEHGKRQLALSKVTPGISWVILNTRWSVNIILWSVDEASMNLALWK